MSRLLRIAGAVCILLSPLAALVLGLSLGHGCAEAPGAGPTAAIIRIHEHAGATIDAAASINEAAEEAKKKVEADAPSSASDYTLHEIGDLLELHSRDPI